MTMDDMFGAPGHPPGRQPEQDGDHVPAPNESDWDDFDSPPAAGARKSPEMTQLDSFYEVKTAARRAEAEESRGHFTLTDVTPPVALAVLTAVALTAIMLLRSPGQRIDQWLRWIMMALASITVGLIAHRQGWKYGSASALVVIGLILIAQWSSLVIPILLCAVVVFLILVNRD